jgi:hypothetical protein
MEYEPPRLKSGLQQQQQQKVLLQHKHRCENFKYINGEIIYNCKEIERIKCLVAKHIIAATGFRESQKS